ncbi:MAG: hypothetical protein Q7U20_09820 [Caulobacter sp.]|nr:hypothetical protein [Caulobacter sp.]
MGLTAGLFVASQPSDASAKPLAACMVGVVNADRDGDDAYIGNPGRRYPHLHCGKDFVAISKGASKHKNIIKGDRGFCNAIIEARDRPDWIDRELTYPADMKAALVSLAAAYCPGQ